MSDQPLWDELSDDNDEEMHEEGHEVPGDLLLLHVDLEKADVTPEEFAAAFGKKSKKGKQ